MMEPVEEIELAGGGINRVVQIGDAVHRPSAPWSPATRELLTLLHDAGLPVPAWRGTDDQGRDVLDYLPGEVGHYPLSEAVRSEAALVSAARLLRRFHDVSVPLVTRDLPWQLAPLPDAEVIVHGDYAPYNLVSSREQVVGIFDLDYARPRLLGHASYMREDAAAGNEAFARHIEEGHAELYERDAAYVTAHLADFGA